jgi:hypothetical protein
MIRTSTLTAYGSALVVLVALGSATVLRALDGPTEGMPNPAQAAEVCRYVAARGPAIRSELVREGVLDANNDGIDDHVTIGIGSGTMRGDVLEFRPRGAAKDSKPVEFGYDEASLHDYWWFGERWFPYGGRVYTLYFEAETVRRVVALGIIDRNNKHHLVCDFEVDEQERLEPLNDAAAGLCARVARDELLEVQPTPADGETPRRETRLIGRLHLDFRNTGKPEALALLDYESGSARGCGFKYYDTLEPTLGANSPSRATLLAAQHIDLAGQDPKEYAPSEAQLTPYLDPPHCGIVTARWLVDRGKTYLDQAAERDHGLRERFRSVMMIDGTRVTPRCKGAYEVQWRVKSMAPAFR